VHYKSLDKKVKHFANKFHFLRVPYLALPCLPRWVSAHRGVILFAVDAKSPLYGKTVDICRSLELCFHQMMETLIGINVMESYNRPGA
jgi:hypothetical protein